jgi:hypothetical protein
VAFGILTAVNMKITFFWNLTPPHSILKMEAAGTIYQTKWRHIPDDRNLNDKNVIWFDTDTLVLVLPMHASRGLGNYSNET